MVENLFEGNTREEEISVNKKGWYMYRVDSNSKEDSDGRKIKKTGVSESVKYGVGEVGRGGKGRIELDERDVIVVDK